MKRRTTFRGAPTKNAGMSKAWFANWPAMNQASIQAWIEGLPGNIQKVIELEGGNEYREGRNSKRSYRARRKVGHLYHHSWIGEDGELEQDAEDEAWIDDNDADKNSDHMGNIINKAGKNSEEGQSLSSEGSTAQISVGVPSQRQTQTSNLPPTRVTRSQAKKNKTPS
jgi:hypothetical protein